MTAGTAAAFESHGRFVHDEGEVFDISGLDFEGWVRVGAEEIVLVQEVPMLDATVVGETVAPVVEDGWFYTFERRVGDVTNVTKVDLGEPSIDREGEKVHIEVRLQAGDEGPEAVIAAASYIEGTWVEGIIPGYVYDETVQSIRIRARQNAQDQP